MIKDLFFLKQAPKTATAEDMRILEAKLGVQLPLAFHEFCLRWNGGFPGSNNEYYPVPPSFKDFYANMFYERKWEGAGIRADILLGATEEFMQCNLLKQYALYEGRRNGFIPITNNLEGNRAVLRANSPMGMVYWIDSDTWERSSNKEDPRPLLMPIAKSLEEFYNALTPDPNPI